LFVFSKAPAACGRAAGTSWLAFSTNVVIFGLIASCASILMALMFPPSPESLAPLVLSNIFQLSGEGQRAASAWAPLAAEA
jgi:hypothetical protein